MPIDIRGNYDPEAVDQLDLSIARDNQGEASEEQGKARSDEGNETSGNPIKATHDTSL
jgi:hypothetical protein